MPKLSFAEGAVTQIASQYLKGCNKIIAQLISQEISPIDIHRFRSQMIDQLIVGLFEKFSKELNPKQKEEYKSISLIATGGYGREEMAVLSDIDLLFLSEAGSADFCRNLSEKILYVLWDLKLDVGHAVRTVAESYQFIEEDQTIFTSHLDMRLLVGDEALFKDLRTTKRGLLKKASFQKKMFLEKVNERNERLKKYGGTVYLLEPHIKEGEGGLRDLQFIRWLGRIIQLKSSFAAFKEVGLVNDQVCEELEFAFKFYLRLRNELHVLLKRKSDQLNFETQVVLAREMGFIDDETSLGVENFMRAYYTVATQVNRHVRALVQKIASHLKVKLSKTTSQGKDRVLDENFCVSDGAIKVRDDQLFQNNFHALMNLFLHVQRTGLGVHFVTRDQIMKELHRVDDAFREDPGVCRDLKSLMGDFNNLGKALFAMHDVHFFDFLIPEFQRIRNRIQHDVYHVYTVDAHSIFSVNEVSHLVKDPEYTKEFSLYRQAALQIERKDLFSFGLLFHDIGKGVGGDHSIKGAEIADRIMQRLGYSDSDRQIVEFLVRSHLIMSHLSQRRDLQDVHMIAEFAKAVGSLDKLNMLFVLTWADVRAVNAEAWTQWKDTLLQTLYEMTAEVLASKQSAEAFVRKKVTDVRKAILKRMRTKIDSEKLEFYLQSISPRYVLSHTDEEIREHFRLITNHDDSSLLFVEKEIDQGTFSELLIYTLSNPRVMPLVTGVLLALGINIFTIENFMLSDGHVLIKMRVQSVGKDSLRKVGVVDVLRQNLYDVFLGRRHIKDLIIKRKRPQFMQKKPVQKAETEIHIDNDVSGYYTVIDVLTHDRLGLIYDIVNCLVSQGCYVELSKISTKVEQVVDTLYVKDIFGQKITDKHKLEEIKRVLSDVIGG